MAILDPFVDFGFCLPSVLMPRALLLLLLPQGRDTLGYLAEPGAELVTDDVFEKFLRLLVTELTTETEPSDVDDSLADDRRQSDHNPLFDDGGCH